MARTFPQGEPHTLRNQWVAALAAAALAASPVLAPLAHADDLHNKQKHVRKHLSSAKQDLDESSRALASARGRLTKARTSLARAQKVLAGTQTQLASARVRDAKAAVALDRAQAALAKAKADYAQSKADAIAQREQIGVLAAQNYQYGDPALMGLVAVLNSSSPTDVTVQVNTVRSMMNRQADSLDTLKATEHRMQTQSKKVFLTTQQVAQMRAEAASNLTQKQKIETAAAAARADVRSLVSARSVAEHSAARVKRSDLAKLKQLQAEDNKLKAQILARARHQRGGYKGTTNGYLARPVPGYVTSPYGWRIHPIYGYWGLHDGVDFHAPCGTPEVAAGGGTVVSKYYSDVWGNRLLIDLGRVNGKNVTVIYNHLSGYRVGSGEHVKRGEVIGWSGTTGWSTACHLHFTVMINGSTVDPMPWL